jgi:hypothetical protein
MDIFHVNQQRQLFFPREELVRIDLNRIGPTANSDPLITP